MSGDYLLVGSVLMGLLAFPSLLSAFTHGRNPLMAVLWLTGSGTCLLFAFRYTPQGYTFGEIPDVFIRVIGAMLN